MYQIDNSTAASTIPVSTAAGLAGFFTDGDPVSNIAPTVLPAEFMNMMMLELLNVLGAASVTPSKSRFNQLALAITQMIQSSGAQYAIDSGAANACVVPYSPVLTGTVDGLMLRFRAKVGNPSGACTFAPNMLVPKPIIGMAGPLQGGEISANSMCIVVYSAALDSWVLVASSGSNLQVPAAINSLHAVNLGQVQSLINASKGLFYVNAATAPSTPIVPGIYLVDTSGGALTLTLPASPFVGLSNYKFVDPANNWAVNNWTLARNGKTIVGNASDLISNVSDQEFYCMWTGITWRAF